MKAWFIVLFAAGLSVDVTAGERIVFADQKLSFELPDGWKKSERNQGTTLGGWESPDQTSSVFFQQMNVTVGLSMTDIMDDIIDNFEKNEGMVFRKVGEYKTGQVNGPGKKKFPAIYTTLDSTLKATPKDFEIQFYLFVFDTGSTQYFMQASITKPVWDVREKQIMSLVRSLIVRN
jgi:hypothetical protein